MALRLFRLAAIQAESKSSRIVHSDQFPQSIRNFRLVTSSTMGYAAGLCYLRASPAVYASMDRVCLPGRATAATISFSSTAGVFKPRRSGFTNANLSKSAWDCFSSKSFLSSGTCNLHQLTDRAYDARRGSPHETNPSTAAQVTYDQYEQQDRDEFPRPPTIKWDKDICNVVQLIGRLGRDVDIKYLDTGKVYARTSIAVRKSTTSEDPSWFEVEFWDALAEIAAHHLKKGEQVYVTGRVVIDKWTKNEVEHTVAKVVVKDIYFVAPYVGTKGAFAQPTLVQQDQYIEAGASNQTRRVVTTSPPQVNRSQQVVIQSPQGTAGPSKNNDEASLATEKRWLEYFADPSQWWDNRNNKKNPKAPDFKHKSTQEALWIESWSNPPWVKKQLMVLEQKQAEDTGDSGDSHVAPKNKRLSTFQEYDIPY